MLNVKKNVPLVIASGWEVLYEKDNADNMHMLRHVLK